MRQNDITSTRRDETILAYTEVIILEGQESQEKPWHKHEDLSPVIVAEAESLGVTIKTNSRANSKLSYDLYSH